MDAQDWRRRLIIGITGASGTIYGLRLLQVCRALGLEVHLCMSKAAELTLAYELDMRAAEVRALAHKSYAPSDVGAAIASGSFRTRGMIIAPCSIRTMAEIATGKMSAPFTQLSNMVLSHASEEGAATEGKGANAGKSIVDNLKSMLAKPKDKAA